MKYTVVIRQPVPEHIQTDLTQELIQHFALDGEQASKLAARRSGRLMKPTSRKRAERLLEVFQSVGAQVNLEEIRDDTQAMPSVFAPAERSGLVGPAGSSFGGGLGGLSQGGGSVLSALEGGVFAASASNLAGPDWTAGTSALAPSALAPGLHFPEPLAPMPDFVQHDADLLTPQQVSSFVPDMNLVTPGQSQSAQGQPAQSQSAQSQPAQGQPAQGHSAQGQPAQMQLPPAAADNAWADFTGSLADGAARPAANATSVTATSISDMSAAHTMIDSDLSAAAPIKTPRSSLARRVLVSALLPLLLFTVVTLAFLLYVLPRAQNQLIAENAQAVAVAVGSNLDVTDQNTVNAQLDALIKRSSVGFVQVNLPDGTTFFKGKNDAADGPLSERIATWVQTHPTTSTFVQSGSSADAYRYQLSLLEQVGAGDSSQAKLLKAQAANPANQKSSTTTYVLATINVTQSAQGARVVQQGVKNANGMQLYSIVVGVPSDSAFRLLTNTLLLVLAVALIAFVIAALLAVRTARTVVEPIERLVRAADAISMGDLERPVKVERNDEIGDLAQALERMRLSLEAAMERLRKRRSKA
ncbi:HAMP domain-containing protein [Deinococcus sp.]|uniref:HAMP domain-containing protein n=1 Tax=Deinococcus sp. TaxID=47478 RepID=UPI003CC63E85